MNKKWLVYILILVPGILFSQNIKLRELQAFVNVKQGNYKSATDTFDVLIEESPTSDLYLAKAKILYTLGDFQQALEYCNKSDKLKPFSSSELKIKVYLKEDDKENTQVALEENLKSKYKISLYYLLNNADFVGIYNMELDQYVLSGNFYSQTEKQIYQVERLMANQKNSQALFVVNEILLRNDDIAEVHYLKSQLTFESGDIESASREISAAVELKKSNPDYLKQRIKIYKELKKYDEALDDANKLVRIESNQIENYIIKADLLFETDQFEQASELTESLLKILPNDPDLLYLSSKSYYGKEDYFDALKAINQSMEIKTSKEAFELRGNIYSATGTYKYAVRDYSMYLDIEPYNGDIYAKKGYARLKTGDKNGACSDWKKGKRYGSYDAVNYLEKYCE